MAGGDALLQRARAILKDRVEARCGRDALHARNIDLAIDGALAPEAFRIEDAGDAIRIAGGSARGVLYGIGKFLRTSDYSNGFAPSSWRGVSEPQGTVRGMYFATHFHNWYHVASEAEIVRYTEDLALWGMNAVMVLFPVINLRGWDDPEAAPAMEMVRRYAKAARDLGLQFGTFAGNCGFSGTPEHLLATPLADPTGRRGNTGFPICPSNPEGHALIMENARRLFQQLADVGLDFLCHWPYDEGGCGCSECRPWGSSGYFRLSHGLSRLAREYFPGLKTILSTWAFDTPPEGEWEGISRELARGNDWLDYILADAHEDFPAYPLQNGVPGGLPLINFPEISMWGLFPWGGFGATPLPRRFQRLWDQVKSVVSGGFPYSEGIHEDINKAVVAQFYWDRDRTADETLQEYIAYEYAPEATDDVLRLVALLERTHTQSALDGAKNALRIRRESGSPQGIAEMEGVVRLGEASLDAMGARHEVDLEAAEEAQRLAQKITAGLHDWAAQGWRWRMLYLRAVLEQYRLAPDGLQTPEAKVALKELIEILHSRLDDDGSDPFHCRVRPPLSSCRRWTRSY